jgi:hypothetical protein
VIGGNFFCAIFFFGLELTKKKNNLEHLSLPFGLGLVAICGCGPPRPKNTSSLVKTPLVFCVDQSHLLFFFGTFSVIFGTIIPLFDYTPSSSTCLFLIFGL